MSNCLQVVLKQADASSLGSPSVTKRILIADGVCRCNPNGISSYGNLCDKMIITQVGIGMRKDC